jgi:hypothetical protein
MSEERKCLECNIVLDDEVGVETDQGAFCEACYGVLLETVKEFAATQNKNINYPLSVFGGVAGGVIGACIWWAVTFYSGYAVGIVAIVIGIAVAKGITLCNGGKKSLSLQIIASIVTVISFFYAKYLVTRSFILAEGPSEYLDVFTLLPQPHVFYNLVMETSDILTIVFLGIAVWQAWIMTKPYKMIEKQENE